MKNTLVTKIVGGLGNQMFQYAMAYSLAYDKDMELRLDISWFENTGTSTPREFELNIFNSNIAYFNNSKLWLMNLGARRPRLARIINMLIKPNFQVVNEPSFRYWHEVHQLSGDIYLNGFWQTEKYFSENKHIIKKLFSFPEVDEPHNLIYKAEMEHYINSVSLHVRRGDYISDANTNSYHGTCNMEYYQKAIERIEEDFSDAHFFIFSDDPEWVKKTFISSNVTIVMGNFGKLSYRDMQLMTFCKHHILANSSFSWWGAWLSHEDGVTITPNNWFAEEALDTSDLYCKSWIRI